MGAAAARRGGVRAAEAPLHEELSASSGGAMRQRPGLQRDAMQRCAMRPFPIQPPLY